MVRVQPPRFHGFPPTSPGESRQVGLLFDSSLDLVDTGKGQTLRQALGGAVFIDAPISACGNIRFGDSVIIATAFVDVGDNVLDMI